MNLLPNFSYSKALSAFLTATNAEQKEDANILVRCSLCKSIHLIFFSAGGCNSQISWCYYTFD